MTETASTRYKQALQRGHVAVVRGRPREAVEHYREAASLAPDRPLPLVRIGEVLLQMEEPRNALVAYQAALDRAPDDVTALRGMAAALAADGHEPEARLAAERASRLEAAERAGLGGHGPRRPVDPRLAEFEGHAISGALARRAGDRGIAAAAYLVAANGFVSVGDFEAALDACLHGLEAQPGNIDIHFVMAVIYLRRGWNELGVQRALLIERRLDIDDDPLRRNALAALARDFRTRAPELERLATITA